MISAEMLAEDQLRKMARNGAYAAAEAKRRKKTMREALEMMMYDVKLDEQTKDRLRANGIEGDEHMNHQMVITRSLIAKAEAGDVPAYNAICAMIGEKPADRMEVSGDLFRNLRVVGQTKKNDGFVPMSEDEIPE